MDFNTRKQQVLSILLSQEPDRSRKGGVDAPIADLIDSINKHPAYYTTSSCSGRISILQELAAPQNNEGGDNKQKQKLKKKAGDWIFVSHEPADPDHVANMLVAHSFNNGGLVVFRFEPFILALDCSDISAAQSLVASAISCGFRESGITSIGKRIMVALRCSIRMEVPVADKGQMLVSRDYIRYLVNLANEKMESNKKRTEHFYRVFKEQLEGGNSPSMASDSFQLQRNCSNPEMRKQRTRKRLNKSSSSQESFKDHSGFAELELRQLNILSRITALEETVACYSITCIEIPVTNSKVDCHDEQSTFSKVLTDKGGRHDGIHIPFSAQQPQKYISGFPECSLQKLVNKNHNSGPSTSSGCRLMAVKMKLVGEPLEKLFRWGHSTCIADFTSSKSLFIFGGYGGLGTHSRQNDTLMLDIETGSLKILNTSNSPTPRMGHTASMVGQCLFIIGGREDPTRILNDVWFLNMAELKWYLLEFNGAIFPARHRHAAAVVDSCIYVFGGVHDATIYGDMYVLDTNILQWKQVEAKGELPSARHSHSLAVMGRTIYLFGGFDGSRILGDLYSYDVNTGFWKNVETTGRMPGPKFSHSLFAFDKYLAVLGGCPVAQQFEELALLDLEHLVWRHVSVSSINDCLLVRSTVNVVGDNLIIIGGGSSCYAFGTKFNEPLTLGLGSLRILEQEHWHDRKKVTTQHVNILQTSATTGWKNSAVHSNGTEEGMILPVNKDFPASRIANTSTGNNKIQDKGEPLDRNSNWILKLDKISAKLGKDALKKLGWLDLSRKARVIEQGSCICFPITEEAACFLHNKNSTLVGEMEDDSFICDSSVVRMRKGIPKNEVSFPVLLSILTSCHGKVVKGDNCSRSKELKSPQESLQEAVSLLTKQKGLSPSILEELPSRWERLGDMAVLPITSFKDDSWHSLGNELWVTVARSLGVRRLARQGRIAPTGTRDSTLELLFGDNGWVEHRENGILYCFDATKCMFSSGNVSEKLRMAKLDCRNEIVVDLFAGVGYFVLPFLLKAGAKLVYACEWNPNALVALRHNISVNGVGNRCIILEGDNCITAPKGVADRVCLGLLPSSELSWCTAVRALRPEGGILHVHANVKDTEEDSWLENLALSIKTFAHTEGYTWNARIEHLERVKWYAPHIRHLVADVRCTSM